MKFPKNQYIYGIGIVALVLVAFYINNSISYSNRPVLDPNQFRDYDTKRAYQLAVDYSDVLKTQRCYCGCSVHSGHKNLLDCFRDTHGSECNTCMNEAFDTIDMYKKGMSIEQIKANIDRKYGGLMADHN